MERPEGLPTWGELVKLPEADAKRILEPFVAQYDDETLGGWFQVSAQRVGYFRRKLGLEKSRGRGTNAVKSTKQNEKGVIQMGRQQSQPQEFTLGLPTGTLELSMSGRFSREELFKKLEKLRAVVNLLETQSFSVSIQISELNDTPDFEDEGFNSEF
ncbi:MAG: hypothetical protein JRE40_11545 [Deltaproteobacteria bacterium]|nr:hypothetical protein [Deltaproteobacteria bacterium]